MHFTIHGYVGRSERDCTADDHRGLVVGVDVGGQVRRSVRAQPIHHDGNRFMGVPVALMRRRDHPSELGAGPSVVPDGGCTVPTATPLVRCRTIQLNQRSDRSAERPVTWRV